MRSKQNNITTTSHTLLQLSNRALYGNVLEYWHLIQAPVSATWTTSLANDIVRLAQDVGTQMGRLVASMCPNKAQNHRVQVTAGGDSR